MLTPHQDAHEQRSNRRIQRKLLSYLAVFFAIQGILAAFISFQAKRIERRRVATRPSEHPSRSFERVQLDHRSEGSAFVHERS